MICLTEQPMSGYEIARKFESSIGFFWHADHQQIYRELSRLRNRGGVEATEVQQSGRPNKLVYHLTEHGRTQLREWSREPSSSASVKDDLLVRLYALDSIDLNALRADLATRLAYHRDRLSKFEHILERYYGADSDGELGKKLGLSLGLKSERGWVEWCEEALQALSGRNLNR